MRAQHDVRIDCPIGEVFDFLANGANNPRWQSRVIRTVQVGDQLGVGTSFRQSMRHPFGFAVSANYRLTVFERPQALALIGTSGGPIRPTETYELTENGPASTTVRYTIEYQPTGMASVMVPMLAFMHPLFAREASWIDNARDVLESAARASDVP